MTAQSEKEAWRYADELEQERKRLQQVCRNVYEVWAGSEGIPMPETAAEGYLLSLVEQMRDEAKEGLKPVKTYSGGIPNYCTEMEQETVDALNMSQERVYGIEKVKHEPVAWRYKAISKWTHAEHRYLELLNGAEDFDNLEPLYTAPPKREWVTLTDVEFEEACGDLEDLTDIWYALEDKLKNKNGY